MNQLKIHIGDYLGQFFDSTKGEIWLTFTFFKNSHFRLFQISSIFQSNVSHHQKQQQLSQKSN